MFLIQGQGKAILYTGDIRSESWWINSLVRNPVLVPYTFGTLRLDKIYLDTTFAVNSDQYRCFPSKAEGLRELLELIALYPDDTVFHFNAWTLGYEEVWIALSSALKSQVHVDQYKMRLYKSIAPLLENRVNCHEGPPLCGFKFGNRYQSGCLTSNQDTRLHSCERGTVCSALEDTDVVTITPIISRLSTGAELPELGAGGGGGDLNETHELELDDAGEVGMLLKLCVDKVSDPTSVAKIITLISTAMVSDRQRLPLGGLALAADGDNLTLSDFAKLLMITAEGKESQGQEKRVKPGSNRSHKRTSSGALSDELPRTITFPYSRHSSYEELCLLVKAFKPKDLYPCTTDEERWHHGVSMSALFGHLCSATTFSHDQEMNAALCERALAQNRKRQRDPVELDDYFTPTSQSSGESNESSHRWRHDAVDQIAKAAAAPIGTDIDESERPMNTLPEHIVKKSKHHHAGATESDTSQQDRIDIVTKSFNGPDTTRGRQREIDKVQIRNNSSVVQSFSNREESCIGSQVVEPHKARSYFPIAPASSRTAKTLKSVPKIHRCLWQGRDERFSSKTFSDGLNRHVKERHCVEITIKGQACYGCLWGRCPTPEIVYLPSEDLWDEHVYEKHLKIMAAPSRISKSSNTQGSSSNPTPLKEPRLLCVSTHSEESTKQPSLTTSRSYAEDINNKENDADNLALPSSLQESLFFDSQSTIFADNRAEERLQHRKEAFDATVDACGADAVSLNLISTGDGHTEPELEL
ncbi:MAG: Protein artemis [Candelina mexicana]|nr:MAG: Protein artemis [Candelina mexicana]